MDDLVLAVRELRAAFGDTLQAFAARSGLSISAIANYERDRIPTAKALYQFSKLASEIQRSDLAARFSQAFQAGMGDAQIDIADEVRRSALIALAENEEAQWLEGQLVALIKKARKGKQLTYPIVLALDRTPDQNARITYLESLLVQLRMRSAKSADSLLNELATERAEQTGESFEKSYSQVLLAHPELYARYNQERADAARGTQFESSLAVHGTRQQAGNAKKGGKK